MNAYIHICGLYVDMFVHRETCMYMYVCMYITDMNECLSVDGCMTLQK